MRIVEESRDRLLLESRPKGAFGIAIGLGLLATVGGAYGLLSGGQAPGVDDALGMALGLLFSIGGLLLYRETTTRFDRIAGLVTWRQRGLLVDEAATVPLADVRDVVVGRAASQESGGAGAPVLVLADRRLPLMFGFTAMHAGPRIRDAVMRFISSR